MSDVIKVAGKHHSKSKRCSKNTEHKKKFFKKMRKHLNSPTTKASLSGYLEKHCDSSSGFSKSTLGMNALKSSKRMVVRSIQAKKRDHSVKNDCSHSMQKTKHTENHHFMVMSKVASKESSQRCCFGGNSDFGENKAKIANQKLKPYKKLLLHGCSEISDLINVKEVLENTKITTISSIQMKLKDRLVKQISSIDPKNNSTHFPDGFLLQLQSNQHNKSRNPNFVSRNHWQNITQTANSNASSRLPTKSSDFQSDLQFATSSHVEESGDQNTHMSTKIQQNYEKIKLLLEEETTKDYSFQSTSNFDSTRSSSKPKVCSGPDVRTLLECRQKEQKDTEKCDQKFEEDKTIMSRLLDFSSDEDDMMNYIKRKCEFSTSPGCSYKDAISFHSSDVHDTYDVLADDEHTTMYNSKPNRTSRGVDYSRYDVSNILNEHKAGFKNGLEQDSTHSFDASDSFTNKVFQPSKSEFNYFSSSTLSKTEESFLLRTNFQKTDKMFFDKSSDGSHLLQSGFASEKTNSIDIFENLAYGNRRSPFESMQFNNSYDENLKIPLTTSLNKIRNYAGRSEKVRRGELSSPRNGINRSFDQGSDTSLNVHHSFKIKNTQLSDDQPPTISIKSNLPSSRTSTNEIDYSRYDVGNLLFGQKSVFRNDQKEGSSRPFNKLLFTDENYI